MTLYHTLNVGAAGLTTYGKAIGVVGNNIANVSTLGYKQQNVHFADTFYQTLGSSAANIPKQLGSGVTIASISSNQAQGNITASSSATDMAINGRGFFALKNPVSLQMQYSRAGNFSLDQSQTLVNSQGLHVQGWKTDINAAVIGPIGSINLANASTKALASTTVDLGISLNANPSPLAAGTVFNPLDPTTYHYKTDTVVYDSLGQQHAESFYFTKMGTNAAGNGVWDFRVTVDGAAIGGVAGVPTEPMAAIPSTVTAGVVTASGSQSLEFNSSGALLKEKSPALTFNWTGAAASSISHNFGNAIALDAQGKLGTGQDLSVQLAGPFATRSLKQNGYAAGQLNSIETSANGTLYGLFSNGQRQALFQLALANFANVDGLKRQGQNMLSATTASGTAVLNTAGTAGMGLIQGNSLEQSNVDIANEFVKMIEIQRGYEGNSKVVITTDQMLTTLMALKR